MKRNKFALSYTQLASINMGNLYPVGLTEVLPGDTIQQATSLLLRCSPLLAPVMHPVDIRLHHWYVPNRLLWDQWEDFITGGPTGTDASVFPTRNFIPATPIPVGGLSDFLGIPPGYVGTVNALPYRAYYMIWNEYYRDQDLQAELPVPKTSGDDAIVYQIQNVNWEKDYFTSARPWEQKGPQVSIPITGSATVIPNTADKRPIFTGAHGVGADSYLVGLATSQTPNWQTSATTTANIEWKNPNLKTGTFTGGTTVQHLREAFAIQRFEEARARYGSRYTEYLRYLGVRSSDARLQRPEYLGGGKQTVQFSEVLQTAEGESAPVGEMRGHGIAGMRSNRYRRFFEEHGYILSLLSVRPKSIYMMGIERTWNRRTKEDFWQRELETIGQQEVLNKEIYAVHSDPNGTFGWQDRYDEYRRHTSVVAGEFRSSLLNFWHLARDFATPPALNSDFVKCVPTERVFAVPSKDVMYVMCRHSIQARRMLGRVARNRIF